MRLFAVISFYAPLLCPCPLLLELTVKIKYYYQDNFRSLC